MNVIDFKKLSMLFVRKVVSTFRQHALNALALAAPESRTRGMPLHLTKLCVGCDTIRDLEEWIEENRSHARRLGRAYEQTHTTRMMPKRCDALLDGGSLYWVVKGYLACRQRLLAVRAFTDGDGIGRCRPRAGAGRDRRRAAPVPPVPRLALPRGKGRPARSRPRHGRPRRHARGPAPRARRSWALVIARIG